MNTRSKPIKVWGRGWTIQNDDGRLEGFVELSPTNGIVGKCSSCVVGAVHVCSSGADVLVLMDLHLGDCAGPLAHSEVPKGSHVACWHSRCQLHGL